MSREDEIPRSARSVQVVSLKWSNRRGLRRPCGPRWPHALTAEPGHHSSRGHVVARGGSGPVSPKRGGEERSAPGGIGEAGHRLPFDLPQGRPPRPVAPPSPCGIRWMTHAARARWESATTSRSTSRTWPVFPVKVKFDQACHGAPSGRSARVASRPRRSCGNSESVTVSQRPFCMCRPRFVRFCADCCCSAARFPARIVAVQGAGRSRSRRGAGAGGRVIWHVRKFARVRRNQLAVEVNYSHPI